MAHRTPGSRTARYLLQTPAAAATATRTLGGAASSTHSPSRMCAGLPMRPRWRSRTCSPEWRTNSECTCYGCPTSILHVIIYSRCVGTAEAGKVCSKGDSLAELGHGVGLGTLQQRVLRSLDVALLACTQVSHQASAIGSLRSPEIRVSVSQRQAGQLEAYSMGSGSPTRNKKAIYVMAALTLPCLQARVLQRPRVGEGHVPRVGGLVHGVQVERRLQL
jgi:hypothetical protein